MNLNGVQVVFSQTYNLLCHQVANEICTGDNTSKFIVGG